MFFSIQAGFSQLTPMHVLKNLKKRTCPGLDPVTPL